MKQVMVAKQEKREFILIAVIIGPLNGNVLQALGPLFEGNAPRPGNFWNSDPLNKRLRWLCIQELYLRLTISPG